MIPNYLKQTKWTNKNTKSPKNTYKKKIIKKITYDKINRCTRAGLKQITCPSGLSFDIEKQTCDWKAKVSNCDKKESKSQTKGKYLFLKQNLSDKHEEAQRCSLKVFFL